MIHWAKGWGVRESSLEQRTGFWLNDLWPIVAPIEMTNMGGRVILVRCEKTYPVTNLVRLP